MPIMEEIHCSDCDFSTTSEFFMDKHHLKHITKSSYYCNICDFDAMFLSKYEKHMRIHTGEKPYSCSICSFKSSRSERIKQHVLIHTNEYPFQCSQCDYKSKQAGQLKRHMIKHTKENLLQCDECSYTTELSSNLKRHKVTHDDSRIALYCTLCNYKTRESINFDMHMIAHTKKETLHCKICDFKTLFVANFRKHEKSHTQYTSLSCPYCDYIADQPRLLSIHLVSHRRKNILTCSHCNFKTVFVVALNRHMENNHSTEFAMKCPDCEYWTTRAADLKQHKISHNIKKKISSSGDFKIPINRMSNHTSSRPKRIVIKNISDDFIYENNLNKNKLYEMYTMKEKGKSKFTSSSDKSSILDCKSIKFELGMSSSNLSKNIVCGLKVNGLVEVNGNNSCLKKKTNQEILLKQSLQANSASSAQKHKFVKQDNCEECKKGFVSLIELNLHMKRHQR